MRIGGIWRYHMRTSWRSLTLIGVIVLVLFMAVLVFMSPYMAETLSEAVHLGTDEVVVTRTELNKPMLTSPFGTNGFIYAVYMIVYTITSMMSDRRYLLSNNVTRYEFMIGSYLSAATMAGLLVCMQYVIDLICRIATYLMGFQIGGMVWTPQLILCSTADYLPSLVAQIGNLIAVSGTWTLIVLLFARWKKLCIALCVLALLLPVMLVNFLPANWTEWLLNNAAYVYQQLMDFFARNKWLFLVDVPAWQVLLQQTVAGALMYGIGYLAIRKMPVRTK